MTTNKKITIAIADDHTIFRRGMVSLLAMIPDFQIIHEAGNGQEMIEAVERQMPDIILMDLQMPVLDGIKATQQLIAKYPSIKIIVVSMHDEERFVSHMIELGASGYLLKDADPDEIENAIRVVEKDGNYYGKFLLQIMRNKLVQRAAKKEKIALLPDIDLSDRELEILNFICEGMTTPEIADKICLSTRTVEGHRNRIMEKTGTRNVAGMVAWAIRSGIC